MSAKFIGVAMRKAATCGHCAKTLVMNVEIEDVSPIEVVFDLLAGEVQTGVVGGVAIDGRGIDGCAFRLEE